MVQAWTTRTGMPYKSLEVTTHCKKTLTSLHKTKTQAVFDLIIPVSRRIEHGTPPGFRLPWSACWYRLLVDGGGIMRYRLATGSLSIAYS
jgi:hypothetical protein